MRLTQFSNFAVRILMYAGLKGPSPSALPEIARAYGISHDHLKKASAELCRLGHLEASRGRGGGVRLAKDARSIVLGEVVRRTEENVILVECFDPKTNTCPLHADCRFRLALTEALDAFFAVLDRHTLADLIADRQRLMARLGIDQLSCPSQRLEGQSSAPP